MQTGENTSGGNRISCFLLLLAAALSAALGAFAGGAAVYLATRQQMAQIAEVQPASLAQDSAAPKQILTVSTTEIETAVTAAVEKVAPAVVTVVGTLPGRETIFGRAGDQQATGSGVIISPQGHILTNNHVVEGATRLAVILANGEELPAVLVSADPYADLAMLKVEGETPAVAVLGNSDTLKPGETVIAIGSPLGEFRNTVTVGVVSATGRALDTGQGYLMEDLIQTDAAINQGNSGGALVNLAGEVIGINTLVVRGNYGSLTAEGLGFAVPVNTARLIAEQIIARGYFARPYLGVRWQAVTPLIARRYNLPVEWGAYVTGVQPGSPSEQAGIRPGDIITRIGEKEIHENSSFVNALFAYQPGQKLAVQIVRDGQTLSIEVTLGEAALSE